MPKPKKFKEAKFDYNRKESYDIQETVKKIQEQRHLYKMDEVKQLHPEFATELPELFKKCYEEEMTDKDIEYLTFQLNLRRRVQNREISFAEANRIVSVYFAEQIQPELLSKDGFKKKD